MVYHGIDVPRADKERKARPAQAFHFLCAVPIRLGNDADRVPVAFEHAADDRWPKARVVYISIANNIYEIKLRNAACGKFRSRSRQKIGWICRRRLLYHAFTLPQTPPHFK